MLKEKLMDDLKVAMREKDNIRKNTVQMVRAAILQIEKDKGIEADDTKILEIIAKEVKSKRDALVDFEKAGREDLINQTKEEMAVLAEYLPKQLTEEEVEAKINEIIAKLGVTSIKEIGLVMKEAKAEIGVAADGKMINEVVRKILK